METNQLITIIGINIATIGIFIPILIWALNRFMNGMNSSIQKLDEDVKNISSRMDSHAKRIDQLYRMFVDLQKEIKEIYKDWNRERK